MSFDDTTKEFNRVVAAVITDDKGRILISQRLEDAMFPLMWEFPGGKVEASETGREALMREIREELGVEIEVGGALIRKNHEYTELIVDFWVFRAKITSGEPKCMACKTFKWVMPTELRDYKFPPADEDVINLLMEEVK